MMRRFLSLLFLLLCGPALAQIHGTITGTAVFSGGSGGGVTLTGINLSGNSFSSGAASGTAIGTVSVTASGGSFSGTLSITGTNASSFQLVGTTLETNGALSCTTYNINLVATQSGATGSPYTQPETITCSGGGGVAISGVTLSVVPNGNITSGGTTPWASGNTYYFSGPCASGTTIATANAVTTGGSFTGAWSVTGANASSFTFSGSSLQCSGTVAGGATYAFNVVATQSGATGSPYSQPVTAYAGQQYYLSTSGSDSNNGLTTGAAWLSPNHAVKCGDFITASSGAYSVSNFAAAKWGAVTCAGNDNVAWVKCASFPNCTFSGSVGGAGSITIANNYWGAQGFVATATSGACFLAWPNGSGQAAIHHIVFANNVANGCTNNGIELTDFDGVGQGEDYTIVVGNAVYNGAQANGPCFSGIGLVSASNTDTAAGTHSYMADNVAWANVDGPNCNGTNNTTDGEGIIVDTPGLNSYVGLVVIENNLLIGNGGSGFEEFTNIAPTSGSVLNLVFRYNTLYANLTDTYRSGTTMWDFQLSNNANNGYLTGIDERNLIAEAQTTHNSSPVYALGASYQSATATTIDLNWLDGLSGQNTINYNTGYLCTSGSNVAAGSPGHGVCASTIVSTSPSFVGAAIPGAPSCTGAADAVACMATTIGNFKPTASGAASYGAISSGGTLGNAVCDANNTTAYILNVTRALPADMDPCG